MADGKTEGLLISQPAVTEQASVLPISVARQDGPGMVPLGQKFKHLGSLIVTLDNGDTIKHRMWLGRFTFTDQQSAFGPQRVRLQVKTQLCESLIILQIVLYGLEWSRVLKYVGQVARMPVQQDELRA